MGKESKQASLMASQFMALMPPGGSPDTVHGLSAMEEPIPESLPQGGIELLS